MSPGMPVGESGHDRPTPDCDLRSSIAALVLGVILALVVAKLVGLIGIGGDDVGVVVVRGRHVPAPAAIPSATRCHPWPAGPTVPVTERLEPAGPCLIAGHHCVEDSRVGRVHDCADHRSVRAGG